MTWSNFQSNTWKPRFRHQWTYAWHPIYPIQFQIPILRFVIISISRNDITHRIWPNPISNPIHGHPKMPLWMASLWAECWNWWILSNLELCGGFNQDRDKIAHTVYNQCRKKKHCQKHNGPEGWVLITKVTSLGHITSSYTNLDQTFSESRSSTNFKISTKHQHLDLGKQLNKN